MIDDFNAARVAALLPIRSHAMHILRAAQF